MVTTAPNDFVRQFHDRMPVVLADADVEAWLGDTPLPLPELERLCLGLPVDALDHLEIAARPKAPKIIETAAPESPKPKEDFGQLGLF
jgi:putative SOS response-associated peptidase YedK